MLDPIELMAERAGELEQTYENNVMLPGLPAPGVLAFKSEPGLPTPYTGRGSVDRGVIEGQLVPNDNADLRLAPSTGMVSPGNNMTLSELDNVYDAATEEVLDALFLIDEDLNSGLDILSNSITTYNGKSMRLQIQQRDMMKEMGKIFRDWWEVTQRDRNKPEVLKTKDTDVGPGTGLAVDTSQSTNSDSGSLLDGLNIGGSRSSKDDDKKNNRRNEKRSKRPKGKWAGLAWDVKTYGGKALDFAKGNAGKLALGAGAGYLAYNAISDNREEDVMTPEKVLAKQKAERTGTMMDPQSGEQITWDEYDSKYGQAKTSEINASTTAPATSTTPVLEPGQASIPSRVQDVSDGSFSTSQMIGAAGLTAMGGTVAAQHMRNRSTIPKPTAGLLPQSPDVPKANTPKTNAKVPKKGILSTLKKVPKLGALNAVLGAANIYGTATDDSLDSREKTTGIADSVGSMGAYAGAMALGPLAPFALSALGISDGISFAGDLMGYDIPSLSGAAGSMVSGAAGGIYDGASAVGDFFGFGDDPTEENVQTAAALTSTNASIPTGGDEFGDINMAPPVAATRKSEKIKELQKVVSNNQTNMITTNPVQAVVNKQKQDEGIGKALSLLKDKPALERKSSESAVTSSLFTAASAMSPGLSSGVNAMYGNTDISDITNMYSSPTTVANNRNTSGGSDSVINEGSLYSNKKIHETQSFFGSMMDRVSSAASKAYDFTPMGMISNLKTSPAISNSLSSVSNSILGADPSTVNTNQSQAGTSSVDTVQVNANTVEVLPKVESTERSNFTTIKEASAPMVDSTPQAPIVVQAPAPKTAPKQHTRIIKQVVQPRPTIDDTPTMIGNGGLGLIGNTLV